MGRGKCDGFRQFQVLPQKNFAIGRCLKVAIAGMVADVLGYSYEGQSRGEMTQQEQVCWERGHPARSGADNWSTMAAPPRQ